MCPVVIISCFQMMDAIILWSTFLPVKVIFPFCCRRFQMRSGGSLILFCFLFAVLCLLCLIVLLTAVIILCRHLFCPTGTQQPAEKAPWQWQWQVFQRLSPSHEQESSAGLWQEVS